MTDPSMTTTSSVDIAQPKSETVLTTTEGLTTSTVSTGGMSSQLEDLQVFGETMVATIEETSSSIDEMIQELSQDGGSEIPTIETGGASTSVGDVAEGLSQPQESHERVASLTPYPGEI